MIKTVAVVGAGALGLYYGGRMALAGLEVSFLARSDLAVLRADGIRLELAGEVFQARPARVAGEPGEIGPVDLVVIALKATANAELPRLLPPLLGPDTLVVNLQNGLGVDEAVAAVAGGPRTVGCLCFVGVNRLAPGRAVCQNEGYIELGAFAGAPEGCAEAVAEAFRAAGVRTRVAASLQAARWRKLVWNVPFNGLTVTEGGITADAVLHQPAREARVRALMREVQAAARAEGVEIEDAFLEQNVQITRSMAYRPSTLVDHLAGRPLEVEPIWGEPLRRARRLGVEVPELARLYRELALLAEAGRPREG